MNNITIYQTYPKTECVHALLSEKRERERERFGARDTPKSRHTRVSRNLFVVVVVDVNLYFLCIDCFCTAHQFPFLVYCK